MQIRMISNRLNDILADNLGPDITYNTFITESILGNIASI